MIKSPYQKMQFLAVFFVIGILSGMWYVTHINERLSVQYTAWINAANGIAIEGTMAHLWFEEIVSGDSKQDIQRDVWAHIDRAETYTQNMLYGSSQNNVDVPALHDQKLREKIVSIQSSLRQFRSIAQERYQFFAESNESNKSRAGASLDQNFDAVFTRFIHHTELFKQHMQQAMQADFNTFRQVLYTVMLLLLLLTFGVSIILRRLDHQREQQARKAHSLARFSEENPNPILYIDAQYHISYANRAALNLMQQAHLSLQQKVPETWQKQCHQTKISTKNHDLSIMLGEKNYTLSFMHTQAEDVHVYARDTTELTQSQRNYKLLSGIIEQTTDLVAVATSSGHISYMNTAGRHILGVPIDENLEHQTIADFHPEAENKKLFSQVLPQVKKDKVWTGESIFKHRNEEEIPMSIVLLHNEDDAHQTHYFSVIARDLRAERTLQSKIEHTQRLESLGVLAGGIAHDFNNILTAIMGNAGLAEQRLGTAHPAQDHLTRIVQASDKAAQLCKQMLAYSGKGRFVIEQINLTQFVYDMVSLLEVSIAKNVVIRYELLETIPAIEVDIAQMQQVIMNLITNANEAIEGKSGVITISNGVTYIDQTYLNGAYADDHLTPGNYVSLEVSDNGCGMDQSVIKKMFDPFFTTKFTGRGLGMSAVLGIIRGHKGALKVYSEPGRGSTLKMLLPTASNSTPQTSVAHTNKRPTPLQSIGGALVVDDDQAILDTAAAMLRVIGFSPVLTAKNGLLGVECYAANQQNIQLVLLDMTMPKLDGEGAFRELRRINADVKVILSSGYNEQEATQRFTGKGLAGFIQKPYLLASLQQLIQSILINDVEQ